MSLARVIERGIEWCTPMADPYYQGEFLFWLDAALEYWLMKHTVMPIESLDCLLDHAANPYDPVHGWQCECLEDADNG